MNLKLIIIMVVFSAFIGACKNKESIAEVATSTQTPVEGNQYIDVTTKFSSVELTERTSYGGVRSNLAGNRKYELNLDVEGVTDGIEFKRLMVDSISLPFSNLIINGEKQSEFLINEDSELVTLNTFRNIYSKDATAPQVVEVISYNLSGLDLAGKAVVEYYKGGKPYYLEIAEIKKLQNIYAP